jgi:uncharacterized protein
MRQDGKIDYIELHGGDVAEAKAFYAAAFGWTFTDYGPDYAAFNEGLDGGFGKEAAAAPLVVLWADDLDAYQDKVRAAGGEIVDPIFSFPGGRRFHFKDPAGNILGVWSET